MDNEKAVVTTNPSAVQTPSAPNPQQAAKPIPAIPVPTRPQSKKSFLKKPFFWIVVVIAFIFAGAYYYIYSNLENKVSQLTHETKPTQKTLNTILTPTINPTPITEWIPYTNAPKEATFKLPKGWFTESFAEGGPDESVHIYNSTSLPKDNCENNPTCESVTFQISKTADGKNAVYDYVSSLKVDDKSINKSLSSTSGSIFYTRKPDILVNKFTGLQYIIERSGKYTPPRTQQVLVKIGTNYYIISASSDNLLQDFIKTIEFQK
jgi:hypothetical protein